MKHGWSRGPLAAAPCTIIWSAVTCREWVDASAAAAAVCAPHAPPLPGTHTDWMPINATLSALLLLYCPPPPIPEDDDGEQLPLYRRQLPPLLQVPFGAPLVLAAHAVVASLPYVPFARQQYWRVVF